MTAVITFGGMMIRLSLPDHLQLEQTTSLNLTADGTELNAAAGGAMPGINLIMFQPLEIQSAGMIDCQ